MRPQVEPFAAAGNPAAEAVGAAARRPDLPDFMVSTDAVLLSNVLQAPDNAKARREPGWNPRPLRETVRDTVEWFAQNGSEPA